MQPLRRRMIVVGGEKVGGYEKKRKKPKKIVVCWKYGKKKRVGFINRGVKICEFGLLVANCRWWF